MNSTYQNEKILIFGGSFDPVHKGHIKLLDQAIKQIKPKFCYIIPTYLSPFKKSHSINTKHRVKMAELSFKKISKCVVIDKFEIKRNKKTYAYENLKYLQKKHPNAKFFLLVGSDCINTLNKWKNFAYIKQNCTILVGKRQGTKINKHINFDYKVLQGDFPQISSSDIRKGMEIWGKFNNNTTPTIKKYIKDNNLYQNHIHTWLNKNLPERRYNHTKHATKLAVELAEKHKVDTTKALIASLIHDMGKTLSVPQKIEYCRKNTIKFKNTKTISDYAPQLLHCYIGEHMAKKIFKIKDKDILTSVRQHTLGSKRMSKLAKIIFIADTGSTDRKYPHATKIRTMAFENLDKALKEAMQVKISYTISSDKYTSLEAIRIWNKIISK